MPRWVLVGLAGLCMPSIARGAFELAPSGARPAGLAGAFVALADDANSLWLNPAGMALVPSITVTSFYTRLYGMEELPSVMAGGVIPTRLAAVGAAYSGLGGELYRESALGLSVSRGIRSRVWLGATARMLSLSIRNYGPWRGTALDLGGMIRLPGGVRLGAAMLGVNRVSIAGKRNQMPRLLQVGVSRTGDRLTLAGQMDREAGRPATGRIGQEFRLASSFVVRTGIQTNPSVFFAGAGVTLPHIETDYAFAAHPVLGLTHRVSVSLFFGRSP